MVLIDMSVKNKNKDKINSGKILKDIFKKNWENDFLFDGLSNHTISYKEFFKMSLSYVKRLEHLGLRKNNTLCLILPNSIELIVFYFTSLLMGLRVVPIDPDKGKNEIKEILSYINYDKIVSIDSELDFVKNKIHLNEFKKIDEISINQDKLNIFEKLNFDEIYLISFTSGSTGESKGVMHSFNNLVKSALAFNDRFNFNTNNIFFHNLPMTYMAGILNLWILPLISGSKIVIGERFDISNIGRFWEIPIKYSANTYWFIPTMLELLLKFDRNSLGSKFTKSIRSIGCVGTAPLDPKTKLEFEAKYSIPLFQSYGLTETLFLTTNSPGVQDPRSVGKALDNVDLILSNDNGEIAVDVPWMFLGYVNIEKKDFFLNEKYLTGDLGKFEKQNFLVITGRKKDLIIKGGINLSPKKIEDYVRNYNFIEEVVILGIQNKFLGEKTVCFYKPNGEISDFDLKKINTEISLSLGKSYLVDEFVELDDIPRNTNGKFDKPKIRENYELSTNASRY